MIGVAVAGLALSAGTMIYGASQKKKAREEQQKLIDNRQAVVNPYANLEVATVGGNFQGQQNLRSEATQLQALNNSGTRGLAFVSQIGRNTALGNQQIAADFNRQRKAIDMKQAEGEIFKFNAQENRDNLDLAGYSSLYAAGEQNVAQGINSFGSVLGSSFATGGAFNRGTGTAPPSNTDFGFNQANIPTFNSYMQPNQQNPQLQFGNSLGTNYGFSPQPLIAQPLIGG